MDVWKSDQKAMETKTMRSRLSTYLIGDMI